MLDASALGYSVGRMTHRTRDNGGTFAPIPTEILSHKDIPAQAKLILAYVWSFTRKGKTCFASNKTVGERTGTSEANARKWIYWLISEGWLTSEGHTSARQLCYHSSREEPSYATTVAEHYATTVAHTREEKLDKTRSVLDQKDSDTSNIIRLDETRSDQTAPLSRRTTPGMSSSPEKRLSPKKNIPDDIRETAEKNGWNPEYIMEEEYDLVRSGGTPF